MIQTRERLEDFEDQILAPYGIRSRNSQGRQYPDSEPEYRTSFQRDRDRILHTTASAAWNIKRRCSLTMKGIISVPA